jgi:hypothetical protein
MEKTRFHLPQKYLDGIENFAKSHGYPPHGSRIARCIHIKREQDIDSMAGDNDRKYVALLCTACANTYAFGKKAIPSELLITFGSIG